MAIINCQPQPIAMAGFAGGSCMNAAPQGEQQSPKENSNLPNREQRLQERRRAVRTRIRLFSGIRAFAMVIALLFLALAAAIATDISRTGADVTRLESDLKTLAAVPEGQRKENEMNAAQLQLGVSRAKYSDMKLGSATIAAMALTSVLLCLVIAPRSLQNELVDIANELDLIAIPSISFEQRAQKQFQIQQLELKRYYNQTLHQSAYIFWVGVASMLVGIAIVIGTIFFVHSWAGADEKVIVGIVGAVGGVLANFVSVIYIKMFSEIIKGVTHSYDALVTMNHLHLANLLIADISDKELREKTLADLAFALKVSVGVSQARSDAKAA
jgi:Ca2+/Na+ antiporter